MTEPNPTVSEEKATVVNHYNHEPNSVHIDDRLERLRAQCPMPQLLHALKLGKYARRSCESPLRNDQHPSWGIYQRGDRWYWKDHGTGDHGDEINLLAQLNNLDSRKDFRQLLDLYEQAAQGTVKADFVEPLFSEVRTPPSFSGVRPTTEDLLKQLALDRGFQLDALRWASDRGVLVFGEFLNYPVYGVTDSSQKSLEWRRMGRQLFPRYGRLPERKSHSVRGSCKRWPLGIPEARDATLILLCEGGPDFLAAHQIIVNEGKRETVAPVTMLSASVMMDSNVLDQFRGKRVRIVPHQDKAGIKAASNWSTQLRALGLAVDFVDLASASGSDSVKDLADYLEFHGNGSVAERRLLI